MGSLDPDPATFACSNLIQSYGFLFVLQQPELAIVQVSENTQNYLNVPPEALIGQPLHQLLSLDQIKAIYQGLQTTANPIPLKLFLPIAKGTPYFDTTIHRMDQFLVLELEPALSSIEGGLPHFHALVRSSIARLQQAGTLEQLLNLLVKELQQLTGYDRIMVYQFDSDGSGCVIAEAKQDSQPSYLDLHFPAIDIPEPVRVFYTEHLVRFIPDIQAPPVALIPPVAPSAQASVDLSPILLRSVAPCFVEYLQNMGVGATLVISLLQNKPFGQTLWGLISCHHPTPKMISAEKRAACELLGQVFALELAHKLHQADLSCKVELQTRLAEVVASLSSAYSLKDALAHPDPRLLNLVEAGGAAVCFQEEITLIGTTPTVAQVKALLAWAETHIAETCFQTHCLVQHYPAAEAFQETASGLLLLTISKIQPYTLLWFRPEVVQTVTWAGDPHEINTVTRGETCQLGPRTSFEQWKETVHGRSLPWKTAEIENALDFRSAIVGLVLNRADELAQMNHQLERSNQELASFAYAASHDLKEPLRGIYNYSTFLLEDYAEILDEAGIDRLQTLVQLSQRMETLIDVLLRFSQLGQRELQVQPTDLNHLLDQVIGVFRASRLDLDFEIQIPRPLPTLSCDAVLMAEVFTNLISNALKYNDRSHKTIEIGYLTSDESSLLQSIAPNLISMGISPLFYVKDNGIGIRERHLKTIFRLFKRLHTRNKYGGGAGAGLSITQKIIDRHQGQLWATSTYGEGSTFYFYLAK
jgi:light-regulated signal transduction histidine kinase (bacteriophytochrome)